MRYKNLVIIGTSHIAQQSLTEVRRAIEKEKPHIIAVELDKKRFYALTRNVKRRASVSDIPKIGVRGFLFMVIGSWIQKKLGKIVGVAPGSEMVAAIKLAKKNNIKVALIDQDIEATARKLSKAFTLKEICKIIADCFRGVFSKKSELEEWGIKNIDLSKVPPKALIKRLIKKVKKRYPSLYKVLIEERNLIMANNLARLMGENKDKKIVAVMGAGHEEEVMRLLKKPEISYTFSITLKQ
jgi:pheromone shutdown-related protein TraB